MHVSPTRSHIVLALEVTVHCTRSVLHFIGLYFPFHAETCNTAERCVKFVVVNDYKNVNNKLCKKLSFCMLNNIKWIAYKKNCMHIQITGFSVSLFVYIYFYLKCNLLVKFLNIFQLMINIAFTRNMKF
jgi:hypothetical protein